MVLGFSYIPYEKSWQLEKEKTLVPLYPIYNSLQLKDDHRPRIKFLSREDQTFSLAL